MTSVLLVLLACWKPTTTGPTSMIGHVYDASGAPLAGLSVETVESRAVTDDAGRFAVNYKEPTQWLTFRHAGVRYQRTYQPADDDTDVRLNLPPLDERTVVCEVIPPCRATLLWHLDDTFDARVDVRCDRDEVDKLYLPAAAPDSATCRGPDTPGAEPTALSTRLDGEVLTLTPPPATLTLDLVTDAEALPRHCEVYVNDVPATPVADGTYTAQSFGYTQVVPVCDGAPGLPRRFYLRDDHTTTLHWQPDGPTLDLTTVHPLLDQLTFAKIDGDDRGIAFTIEAQPDGRFRLPPLRRGTYVLGTGIPRDRLLRVEPSRALDPGVLYWREVPDSARTSEGFEAVGIVVVEEPLDTGAITVEVP